MSPSGDDKQLGFDFEPDGDDRLAQRLREAGPRPGIPPATAERLRLATRAALERKAARRRVARRTRWLAAAAVFALVAITIKFIPWSGGPSGAPLARVVATVGDGPVPGTPVTGGEWLETGSESLLALRVSTGHSIRLAPRSRFRFVGPRRVELTRGALYADSGSDSESPPAITIDTPMGRVEELGTRYTIEVDDEILAVRVRSGRVGVRREGDRYEAGAGTELSIDPTGAVSRAEIPVHGPTWQWVLDAAPAPAIDGQPLAVLLDWAVRETGWRLEFGDPQTAERAPTIEVRGSVEGLSPSEALDTILPTCGLTHTVRSGTLTVRAPSRE